MLTIFSKEDRNIFFFSVLHWFCAFFHFHSQCGIVLLAAFVSVISANGAEKLSDDKSTVTNAEGSAKEKRGIHFHSYAAPYVYHSPVVYHAPIVHHSAPLIHHSVVSAPIIHHAPVVASTHHVISHAPLIAVHHFKRR